MFQKRSALILCLIGPSGGGKTTCATSLLATNHESLQRIVTATSRAPRPGELDGINYHFLTRSEFEDRQKKGDFFESEETHGNLYGTLRGSIDELIAAGIDILLDIDIRGSLTFRRYYPEQTVTIFLAPPSRNVLVERVRNRGDSSEELSRRLLTAKREYQQLHDSSPLIDYLVINREVVESCKTVASILEAERCKLSRVHQAALEELFIATPD